MIFSFKQLYFTLLLLLSVIRWSGGATTQSIGGNSVFATGRWVKIGTTSTGIHKINYSWLKSIGFQHPEKVKIFGSRNEMISRLNSVSDENGPVQIPLQRFTEAGGNETSLLFFVQGPVSRILDPQSGQFYPKLNLAARGISWFFLTEDSSADLLLPVNSKPAGSPDLKITEYDDLLLWDDGQINLLESGDNWYTALVPGGSALSRNFPLTDRIEKEPVIVHAYTAGRSASPTGMDLSVNGNSIGTLHFDPVQPASDQDFASADSLKTSRIVAGQDITLSLRYNGSSADQGWLDHASVQVRRGLNYTGKPLVFADSKSSGKGKVADYQINGAVPGLQLWEITNPLAPVQTPFQVSSGQIIFQAGCENLRWFLLFDPSAQYPGFSKTEEVKNADILHMETPQYLILTPAIFSSQAERLADFHRQKDGLSVAVVTVESIFNELSGGYADISAIRNFVRNLYGQKSGASGSALKYLLLFGKGTYDIVHESGENNPNLIPAYQSANSLNPINSYVSDDFYGILEPGEEFPNGTLDIGIGRIPAATLAEATTAVDKIIHYQDTRTLGDWRNNITFIGDDEDNNIHVDDSEILATMVGKSNPEYHLSKIYLDAYPQVLTPEERYPQVNEAIGRSIQAGDLIVNYIGHASEDGLAHERVLTVDDIKALTNKDKLPLFVTATCDFSRWDMTVKRSAGELLLFQSAGGAIALFSAIRLVYSASNFEVNRSFFKHVFDTDEQGLPIRLGDLIRIVKNENRGSINTLKFCLLGDPALQLDYPQYRCKTLEINHLSANIFSGTLSPLSLVTIAGEIRDTKGKRMDQFDGTLYATVYDQPVGKQTLGNGGLPPFSYSVQENVLFNGIVPVKSGLFSYTFVVPKDVNFNEGAGLIRYYFSNGTIDGNGSFANLHFNGSGAISTADNQGPEIHLYLENEDFQEGGVVSPAPLLIARLSDESGINTSAIGVGHDIVAELDGSGSDSLILNDFYQADAGTWKSGSLNYPLSTLTAGSHTLKLKAWDNAGNSSSVTVHFMVSNGLKINSVHNFPNPFSDQTRFVILHNRYDGWFDVNLEISDITGRICYSGHQSLVSNGYEIGDLTWSPGQSNLLPGNGLYIYRITLTGSDGLRSSASGRLFLKK